MIVEILAVLFTRTILANVKVERHVYSDPYIVFGRALLDLKLELLTGQENIIVFSVIIATILLCERTHKLAPASDTPENLPQVSSRAVTP